MWAQLRQMDGSWFYAKMLAFGEVNYEIAPLPTLRDDDNTVKA